DDPPDPPPLEKEEDEEEHDRDRNDERLSALREQLETFDCREDRDRRRHDAVSIEERDREHSHQDDGAARAGGPGSIRPQETREGQDPPLAAIVEPEDPGVVLCRDEDRESPEDQR